MSREEISSSQHSKPGSALSFRTAGSESLSHQAGDDESPRSFHSTLDSEGHRDKAIEEAVHAQAKHNQAATLVGYHTREIRRVAAAWERTPRAARTRELCMHLVHRIVESHRQRERAMEDLRAAHEAMAAAFRYHAAFPPQRLRRRSLDGPPEPSPRP